MNWINKILLQKILTEILLILLILLILSKN